MVLSGDTFTADSTVVFELDVMLVSARSQTGGAATVVRCEGSVQPLVLSSEDTGPGMVVEDIAFIGCSGEMGGAISVGGHGNTTLRAIQVFNASSSSGGGLMAHGTGNGALARS